MFVSTTIALFTPRARARWAVSVRCSARSALAIGGFVWVGVVWVVVVWVGVVWVGVVWVGVVCTYAVRPRADVGRVDAVGPACADMAGISAHSTIAHAPTRTEIERITRL